MTNTDGLQNVETLINRFGGMRPMARKVDVPVSTIQGWKKRDHIPSDRIDEIVRAAKTNQISLDGFDVTANTANQNTAQAKPTPPSPVAPTASQKQKISPARPTQNNETTQKYSLDARQIKRDAVKRSVITTVSIIAILGGVGYFLFGNEAKEIKNVATNQKQIETRLNSFETTVTDGLNSLSDQVKSLTDNTRPLSTRIATLENQIKSVDLNGLVSRFENLTQTVDGQGNTAQAFANMQSIVTILQNRMDSLDIALEQAKNENAEMAASMENVTSRDLSAAAMLLAMTQMRSNLNRAQPFAEDLSILQELVGQDDPELTAAINRLAPYAESGVLTPEGLSNQLKGVTGDIISSAIRGEDVSIKNKIMARIGQILSVQKDGEPIIGIKEQAIVARAQTALDKGDVKTALQELNKLEGKAANSADPVTQKMQGVVAADQTVSMMMQNLLKKLQNPTQLKTMMQNLPQEIQKQTSGRVIQDDSSGIIILE